MKSNLQDIEVIYQTETDKAVCVRTDEGSKDDIWIPKSQCVFEGKRLKPERGDVVVLTAPEPLLTEKGLL